MRNAGVAVLVIALACSRSTDPVDTVARAASDRASVTTSELVDAIAAVASSPVERRVPAVPALVALAGDTDEEVRFAVAGALASVGGADAAAAIEKLARDDSELVRVEAERARGAAGGSASR